MLMHPILYEDYTQVLQAGVFQNVLYSWMIYVPIIVCWVWYAGEVSGRGGLFWGDERVGWVVRKQENKKRLYVSIIGESTTAYESIFDSNKLQSVLPMEKIRASLKVNRFLNRNHSSGRKSQNVTGIMHG